jgi:phospholipid transport system substrate-binding protein
MKSFRNFFIALLFASFVSVVCAQSGPVGMLETLANQMISGLRAQKATLQNNPKIVYSLANRIIVPHADLAEMSKRVLPPRTWNSATPAQRSQFAKEFTTLLIRTYASALATYTDQTVKFFPLRGPAGNSVRVDSQIVRDNGPPISVNYMVIRRGGSWKVYDMTVEGISILESFRSQFADQLSQGNMNDLLRVIQQHNTSNN